jgi:ABC-type sugar transport system ATPase subunit
MPGRSSSSLLAAIDIEKRYGGIVALAGVSVTIESGQVHALLGANGAGKSTLVKVMAGAEQPTAGRLELDGKPIAFASVADAGDNGVAIVSQELNLFPDLDVLANLFLRREPRRGGLADRRTMRKQALPVLASVGLDPRLLDRPLGSLRLGERQLVEIARALLREPKVLILDEPTSALQAAETARLLGVVKSLRDQGVAIVYVSHFLEDVFATADLVTVLRNGKSVITAAAAEMSIDEAIGHMLGATAEAAAAEANRARRVPTEGAATLKVENASVEGALTDVSMEARGGEVVGLAGLEGAGGLALMEAVFGRRSLSKGRITLPDGRREPRNITAAVRRGVAYVPADRKGLGLMLEKPIFENIAIVKGGPLRALGLLLRRRRMVGRAEHWRSELNIKTPSTEALVGRLSGGNQQKVVLAKWLEADPSVVLLDDPTRGVDVGARLEVHRIISEIAAQGRVVLYSSGDLEEMAEVCDRILIFFGGRLRGEIGRETADESILIHAINTGQVPAPVADAAR